VLVVVDSGFGWEHEAPTRVSAALEILDVANCIDGSLAAIISMYYLSAELFSLWSHPVHMFATGRMRDVQLELLVPP
jgi:hypothetical protein